MRLPLLVVLLCGLAQATSPDDLAERMNRFAVIYNKFAAGIREGKFDLREARRLSKLWREVEQSGNWPRPEKEKEK